MVGSDSTSSGLGSVGKAVARSSCWAAAVAVIIIIIIIIIIKGAIAKPNCFGSGERDGGGASAGCSLAFSFQS